MGTGLSIFVVSVSFLLITGSVFLLGTPTDEQGASPHVTASINTSGHFTAPLQKKAAPSSSAYEGWQTFYTPSAPASKGNITAGRNVDEYVADLIANTPYEKREARFIEAARYLYEHKYPDKAKDLLESLVLDATSRGIAIDSNAFDLLREIYGDEGNTEGFNRLLANIPDSYPQKQEIAAAFDASPGETIRRLENEAEIDATNIQPRYALAMVYYSSGLPWKAAEELHNALNISEEPFLYAKLANIYQRLGQQDLAQEALANAASLDPAYGSAAMY